MKKIKSRWFAMLLILSLVFTMGMPMGMTAFASEEPVTPPADSGTPVTPPAEGGTPVTPPADSSTPATPPADSSTPATPPAEGGTPATPPADGSTPATPPARVLSLQEINAQEVEENVSAQGQALEISNIRIFVKQFGFDDNVTGTTLIAGDQYYFKYKVTNKSGKDLYRMNDGISWLNNNSSDDFTTNTFTASEGTHSVTINAFGYLAFSSTKRSGNVEASYSADADLLVVNLKTIAKSGAPAQEIGSPLVLDAGDSYTVKGTVGFKSNYRLVSLEHVKLYLNETKVANLAKSSNWVLGEGPAKTDFTFTFTAKKGGENIPVKVEGERSWWGNTKSGNTTLVYTTAPMHIVNYSVVGSNGTLIATAGAHTIAKGTEVKEGTAVDFTAAPAEGYCIKEWKVDGVAQIEKTPILKKTVNKPITVTVEFEKKTNATIKITGDDTYDLYVNGQPVNPYGNNRTNWSKKDEYRVQLEGNYLIAAKVYDIGGGNITGLNVEVDFDDSKVADVKGASMWSWAKGQEGTAWYTAPSVTGWTPAVAIKLGEIKRDNEWDKVDGTWIWSTQNDVKDNATPVFFRCTGVAPEVPKHTINVTSDENGTAYIDTEGTASKTVDDGTTVTLNAVPKQGYVFDKWTVGENGEITGTTPGPIYPIVVKGGATYVAHFAKVFKYTLTLDPADNSTGVAKNKVLAMTFNGHIAFKSKFPTEKEMDAQVTAYQPEFRIYSADGNLFESFALRGQELAAADFVKKQPLYPGVNMNSVGYVEDNKVVLDPANDFVAGATYYVLVDRMGIFNPEISIESSEDSPVVAVFPGFEQKEAVQDHDWNFTIASDSGTPGGPSTPGTPQTTVTTVIERDRADGPVATTAIAAEPTPLAAPAVKALAAPAPAQIIEEAIPLGVPVLPKTGEIPASLFYGIGGILAAAGAFMKRK